IDAARHLRTLEHALEQGRLLCLERLPFLVSLLQSRNRSFLRGICNEAPLIQHLLIVAPDIHPGGHRCAIRHPFPFPCHSAGNSLKKNGRYRARPPCTGPGLLSIHFDHDAGRIAVIAPPDRYAESKTHADAPAAGAATYAYAHVGAARRGTINDFRRTIAVLVADNAQVATRRSYGSSTRRFHFPAAGIGGDRTFRVSDRLTGIR